MVSFSRPVIPCFLSKHLLPSTYTAHKIFPLITIAGWRGALGLKRYSVDRHQISKTVQEG